MTSPVSYVNWCPSADGDINFFDAAFNDMHIYVPSAGTVRVDSTWESNLPGLAAERLGDKYLWWALLMFNGLNDPINDVVPGVTLRIPDPGLLRSYLASRSAQTSGRNYLSPQAITTL